MFPVMHRAVGPHCHHGGIAGAPSGYIDTSTVGRVGYEVPFESARREADIHLFASIAHPVSSNGKARDMVGEDSSAEVIRDRLIERETCHRDIISCFAVGRA